MAEYRFNKVSGVLPAILLRNILHHRYFTIIISNHFRVATFKRPMSEIILENEHVLHIAICTDSKTQ